MTEQPPKIVSLFDRKKYDPTVVEERTPVSPDGVDAKSHQLALEVAKMLEQGETHSLIVATIDKVNGEPLVMFEPVPGMQQRTYALLIIGALEMMKDEMRTLAACGPFIPSGNEDEDDYDDDDDDDGETS